jgi:hypothetical protein
MIIDWVFKVISNLLVFLCVCDKMIITTADQKTFICICRKGKGF